MTVFDDSRPIGMQTFHVLNCTQTLGTLYSLLARFTLIVNSLNFCIPLSHLLQTAFKGFFFCQWLPCFYVGRTSGFYIEALFILESYMVQ